MNKYDSLRAWSWVAFLLLIPGTGLLLNLNGATLVGGDDGFELAKSLLAARQPELLPQAWNDQPWFYTLVTGWLIRILGPHAIILRLYGPILCCILFILLSRQASWGISGAMISLVVVCMSDQFLHHLYAAMPEVPVAATSWISLILLSRKCRSMQELYLFGGLSGGLFAAAIHTKLIAVLFLPSLLFLLFVRGCSTARMLLPVWGISFLIPFLTLWSLSPSFNYNELVDSHVLASKAYWSVDQVAPLRFSLTYLYVQPATVLAGFAGAIFAVRSKDLLAVSALILCISISIFAAFHQPWWRYYMVHIDLTLAILGGCGILAHSERIIGAFRRSRKDLALPRGLGISILLVSAFISLLTSFQAQILRSELSLITDQVDRDSDPIVQVLRKHRARINWVFAHDEQYPFFAELLIPPEFLVLSKKRSIATGMNGAAILDLLQERDPEAVLLDKRRPVAPALIQHIEDNYWLEAGNLQTEVWISKRVLHSPSGPKERRLIPLGI